jgi:dihydrofolate reductase
MYLTVVHATIDGDAYFPLFKENEWRVYDQWEHPADERHAHAFTVLTLERTLARE